jgi:hypothetical protein
MDWFRDLGFLGKPGVETQAAIDVAANLNRIKRDPNWRPTKPPGVPTGTPTVSPTPHAAP